MAQESTELVVVEGLSLGYGAGQWVLTDVNMRVRSGEVWAIIGPNGAGKSSLLRALLGTMPTVRGGVSICGRSAEGLTVGERARLVAHVSARSIVSGMTVDQFVMLGRTPHRSLWTVGDTAADRVMVRQALEAVGMGELGHRAFDELSQGQGQLVRLARAMVQEPRLLLLDEPTANLDLGNTERMLGLMRHLAHSNGVGVVAVLHDITSAVNWADRVALVANGGITRVWTNKGEVEDEVLSHAYGVTIRSVWAEDGTRCFYVGG